MTKIIFYFSVLFYILWTIFSIQTNYHFQMDQGQFALRSLEIVKNKELTLLGPTTSIKTVTGKQFFQGPIFYYLSGAILSLNSNPIFYGYILACLILLVNLYLFKNNQNYLILFFLNPLTLAYSNFIWNPNWLLVFLPISLFFLTKKHWFMAGLFLGLSLQFHFQVVLIIIFVLLKFYKNIPKLLLGLVLGYSPIIIFELRHNFYNLKTILEYIFSPKTSSFGFTPHYFIFLVPFFAYYFSKFKLAKLFLLLYFFLTLFFYKKEYPSFSSYQKAVQIILINQKDPNFNVANLVYGDTQAWPLRYLLYTKNFNPNPVYFYPKDRNLWVLSESDPRTSTVWELQNFKSSDVATTIYLDKNLYLYHLMSHNF